MDASTAAARLARAEGASERSRAPGGKAALEELAADYDELLATLQWFVDQGRTDEALRMGSALYRFWITKQRFEDGQRWFGVALGAPGGDRRLRAQASIHAGFMPFWLGQDDRAAELFGAGLEIGRELGDAPLISSSLGGLARVALRTDAAEGRRLAKEALHVSEAAEDQAGISNALHLLGVGAQIAGDLPEARDWMRRRLALVREGGNDFLIASEASNLSMVERQLGDLDEAEALDREALELGERSGDEFTRPFAVAGIAAIATERGHFERAATLLGAAEAMLDAQHMAWPPDERPHYEHMLAVLPDGMGTEAFEQARRIGQAMSADAAVELSLS